MPWHSFYLFCISLMTLQLPMVNMTRDKRLTLHHRRLARGCVVAAVLVRCAVRNVNVCAVAEVGVRAAVVAEHAAARHRQRPRAGRPQRRLNARRAALELRTAVELWGLFSLCVKT